MATAAASVHHLISNPFTRRSSAGFRRPSSSSYLAVRCCEGPAVEVAEKRKTAVVKNGNDSLEICRVLNGMWQTSGGWGRIDRDAAVDAMLRYADAGLSTFDMADHFLEFNLPMAEILSSSCSWILLQSNPIKKRAKHNRSIPTRKLVFTPFQCLLTNDKKRTEVKNGKDSLYICRVINGTWQTSGGWGRIEKDNAVEAMLQYTDAGLNTFDFPDIYGPAEDLYGIFINRVRRERPPGLTKWVPPPVKMTSSYVRESINVSLKRMDVASLDMLQFHWWDYSNLGYLDALKHLTDLKEEGKITTVALTNFDTVRLQKILENGIPVVSNQVQHSIVDMRPQQKMAELCQLTGVKLITSLSRFLFAFALSWHNLDCQTPHWKFIDRYGTVMGGLLSEKFLDTNLTIPFAGPPLNTPSLQKYKRMVDAWGGWSLFQVLLQTLNKIAIKHRVSIPAVAVRYVLDQPGVAGSMVGVRLGLADHIKDNNAIFSLVLDEEDVSSILQVTQEGKDLMKIIGDCGDEYRRA
ncbi:hypothetical protein SASPL_122145 [Salvia splendens]|uniref:NADP-dependent oxidoreductase domain-containing protein n=1 Tax=Salvia splendens TaxID=180675 RepID=A0A8X8XIU8_SALSN|nr:hypothetical protein SASPL_122145 [Salvia splendens]